MFRSGLLDFLPIEFLTQRPRPLARVGLVRVPLERLLQHVVSAASVAAGKHDFRDRNSRFEMTGFKFDRSGKVSDRPCRVLGS